MFLYSYLDNWAHLCHNQVSGICPQCVHMYVNPQLLLTHGYLIKGFATFLKPIFWNTLYLWYPESFHTILPQMSIFDIKHHESNILIIIVKLLGLVAELCPHFDDAVKGLVGNHCLKPDIQLKEGSGVSLVEWHMMNPCPWAWLTHILKHASVEFKSLQTKPSWNCYKTNQLIVLVTTFSQSSYDLTLVHFFRFLKSLCKVWFTKIL